MKTYDKRNLLPQFQLKIHTKNGSEFQSFFENIMEKAYPDFQKIRPYGNMGDGGNDGYRKASGIYYQVYAPIKGSANEADGAKKLRDNFQRLKSEWNEISSIKEYNFVFNDKYAGSVKLLEAAIKDLESSNPEIEFVLFLAKKLETIFFQLNETDIMEIGFDVDRRKVISHTYAYLEYAKDELDSENVNNAQKNLQFVKDLVFTSGDDNLSLEYEILEGRCLQKSEKISEAKEKYISLSKRYPNDPFSLLYLSEIYLLEKDFTKYNELIEKAEKIDPDNWLLKLEQLIGKIQIKETIDTKTIDEETFPDDPKIKSNFYRIYALCFEEAGDQINADNFIERAIHLNPHKFSNYINELALLHHRMFVTEEIKRKRQLSQEILSKTQKIETKFSDSGNIEPRNKAHLNFFKLYAFLVQENFRELERLARDTFRLAITCYFDIIIEQIILGVLQIVIVPQDDLNQLLEYVKLSGREISDELSALLIIQINMAGNLFTNGKRFLEGIHNQKYLDFLKNLESENYERVLDFLLKDIPFAVAVANTFKNYPELRRNIIKNLPEDKNIQKEKLLLLLNFDEKDFNEAFQILKELDLSNLNYSECIPMLQIAQQKEAWEFETAIIEKLLELEKDEKVLFDLKLHLLFAFLNLKKHIKVIELGELLLSENLSKKLLDPRNKEVLLRNTLIACLERSKVDITVLNVAKRLLQKYPLENPSFEFKTGIEAEIFLSNNETENALNTIIEGVKIKKVLTSQEYARLYYLFVRIGDQRCLDMDSLNEIHENTFVKLKDKDKWYFVGNENELDALIINKSNNKYSLLMGKKLGDTVVFEGKYTSESYESEIELIFPIEKYISWQFANNFQKLAREGDLEGVQVIDLPQNGENLDITNILKLFKDINNRTDPIFEVYCKNNIPLALLAVSEGGLPNAVGRIQLENKGFINFSDGTIKDLEKQKDVAKRIVEQNLPFYIDGTSALFLSESGLIQKIHGHIPNLKVPQLVISFLADIADRFRYRPGHAGYMGYARGRITMSSIDKAKSDLIHSNFIESIRLLESKPQNISVISPANKMEYVSDWNIPAELCDACILAQKEDIPVLTEDFLFLKINESETKKKIPEYFSSLALLRVLYEEKKVGFNEYLEYFGYLSSYRFRFLNLNPDDIDKSVFGEGLIKRVKPENIRMLNFPLTLSEDYGVKFQTAFAVVRQFLSKLLADNTVVEEVAEKIFIEIIEGFPTDLDKEYLGQLFLEVCNREIKNSKSKLILQPQNQALQRKLSKLQQTTTIFKWKSNLWKPN